MLFVILATAITIPSPLQPAGEAVVVDASVVERLRDHEGPLDITALPLGQFGSLTLHVERFEVNTPQTRWVIGDQERPLLRDRTPVLLRGHADGFPNSTVYLALTQSRAWGFIDIDDTRLLLDRIDANGALGWRRVDRQDRPPLGVPICGTDEDHNRAMPGATDSGQRLSLDLAVETDYEFLELFGGDLNAAADYVDALYGAIATIYDRDVSLDIELVFVRFWDTPDDPFNMDDPLQPFRMYWNENMGHVDRGLAQFLTGRTNLPYGGVAWLSATCSNFGYSVAGYILGSFTSVTEPSFGNWDITVAAHELGHNCGTGHTHDYDLDECAWGVPSRGSIMSYCHTTTGGGANIDMRFHTYTSAKMRSHIIESPCLIIDCNNNAIDDTIDIADGFSDDMNTDGIPDECQDCNGNGVLDPEDIASGLSDDIDADGQPDECEPDCNGNGQPDDFDIATEFSTDLYGNGIPDECETDCNENGQSDYTELQADMDLDIDRDVHLDACQDCDGDGTPDLIQMNGGGLLWIAGGEERLAMAFHPGSGVPMISTPTNAVASTGDLVISDEGRLMLGDPTGHRVLEIDPSNGAILGDFIAAGAGGLQQPQGLAWGPGGRLFVASQNSDEVLVFDASGTFEAVFVNAKEGVSMPTGLLFTTSGSLLVGTSGGEVFEFDSEGNALGRLVAPSATLSGMHGLLEHADGTLLVTSLVADGIFAFDLLTGSPLGQWDQGGLASGFWALQEPRTLRRGPDGDVYVSTVEGNTSIQVYDNDTARFRRRFYVRATLIEGATGFDFMPPASIDCNGNMIPDSCDIADGTVPDVDGNGVPDDCQCFGDLSGDGAVAVDDILLLLAAWGTAEGDVTGDGQTDINDMLAILAAWGTCR